jgi:hypothetical protein
MAEFSTPAHALRLWCLWSLSSHNNWLATTIQEGEVPFQIGSFAPKTLTEYKSEISSNLSSSIFNVKMPAPHFITFWLKDTVKNARNINPFYIQKALNGIVGKMKRALRLKNGALFSEVQNVKEAEVQLSGHLLGPYTVRVDRHTHRWALPVESLILMHSMAYQTKTSGLS